ncbi:MAG: CoA-binding protein [Bacteroidota bacterium]|nr:CoA-binding protein [Bacteroidota bacterium]
MQKNTVVLGASTNPSRYSNMAVKLLIKHDIPVFPVGIKKGEINGKNITDQLPADKPIHTVTLYLNAKRQEQYYEAILKLKPRRVIFNPGTENPSWAQELENNDINTVERCTLVMLNSGQF